MQLQYSVILALASLIVAQNADDDGITINGTPISGQGTAISCTGNDNLIAGVCVPPMPTISVSGNGGSDSGSDSGDINVGDGDNGGNIIGSGITGNGGGVIQETASGSVTVSYSAGPSGTFSTSINNGETAAPGASSEDSGPSPTSTAGAPMVTAMGLTGAGAAAVAALLL